MWLWLIVFTIFFLSLPILRLWIVSCLTRKLFIRLCMWGLSWACQRAFVFLWDALPMMRADHLLFWAPFWNSSLTRSLISLCFDLLVRTLGDVNVQWEALTNRSCHSLSHRSCQGPISFTHMFPRPVLLFWVHLRSWFNLIDKWEVRNTRF